MGAFDDIPLALDKRRPPTVTSGAFSDIPLAVAPPTPSDPGAISSILSDAIRNPFGTPESRARGDERLKGLGLDVGQGFTDVGGTVGSLGSLATRGVDAATQALTGRSIEQHAAPDNPGGPSFLANLALSLGDRSSALQGDAIRAADILQAEKPAGFAARESAPLVSRSATGDLTLNAPNPDQIVGGVARLAPQLPELIAPAVKLAQGLALIPGISARFAQALGTGVTFGGLNALDVHDRVLRETGDPAAANEAAKQAGAVGLATGSLLFPGTGGAVSRLVTGGLKAVPPLAAQAAGTTAIEQNAVTGKVDPAAIASSAAQTALVAPLVGAAIEGARLPGALQAERVNRFTDKAKAAREAANARVDEFIRKANDIRAARNRAALPAPAASPAATDAGAFSDIPVRPTPPSAAPPAGQGARAPVDLTAAPPDSAPVARAPVGTGGDTGAGGSVAPGVDSATRPPVSAVEGGTAKTFTPQGAEVPVRYALVDASQLVTSHTDSGDINPAFPAALQPRDRGRKASQAQIAKIAGNLNPALLGASATVTDGAPIIGPDGVVESGNARTIAIRRAFAQGGAEGYRQFLTDHLAEFGLPGDALDGLAAPVLVRVRQGEANRAEFARQANQATVASLSPAETARADAARLTADDLNTFRPSEDGNVLAASNDGFVRQFVGRLGINETAGLVGPDGRGNRQLADRIQAAVFAKVYQDPRLIELQAEDADPEIRNILTALKTAAPAFARARAIDDNLGGLDIPRLIADAAQLVRDARHRGQSVDELIGQADAFNQTDPVVADFAQFMARNNRSAKRMGEALDTVAGVLTEELQSRQSVDIFGREEQTAQDIVDNASRTLEKRHANEGRPAPDLFSRQPAAGAATPNGPGAPPSGSGGGQPAASGRAAAGDAARVAEGAGGSRAEVTPLERRRRSQPAPGGDLTEKRALVERTVATLTKGWTNAPEIRIVDREADLPVLPTGDTKGLWTNQGSHETGRIFVVAEHAGDANDIVATVLEEAVVHGGVRALLGDKLNPFLDEVARDQAAGVRRMARQRGFDMKDPEQRREAAEEFIGEQAHKGTTPSFLDKLIVRIARWLRQRFPGFRITRAEIKDLIGKAADFVRQRDASIARTEQAKAGDLVRTRRSRAAPDGPRLGDPESDRILDALFERADQELPGFRSTVEGISRAVNGEPLVAPVKGRPRTVEKVVTDYKGDPTRIKDLVRATVIVETPNRIGPAIDEIKQRMKVLPDGQRNLWAPGSPSMNGYRDAKVNVDLGNGLVGEVQVNVPAMLEAKSKLHHFYVEDEARSRKAKQENRPLTPQEEQARLAARAAMAKGYAAAEKVALSARNSSKDTGVPFLMRSPQGKGLESGSQALAVTPPSREAGTPSTSKNSASAVKSDRFINLPSTESIAQNPPAGISRRRRKATIIRAGERIADAYQRKYGQPAYDALARYATRVLDPLKLVNTTPPEFRRMLRAFRAEQFRAGRLVERPAKFLASIPAEERRMVSDYIEGEMKVGDIPPKRVVDVARNLTALFEAQSDELMKLGMLNAESREFYRERYLPRYYAKHIQEGALERLLRRRFMAIDGSHLKGRGRFEVIRKQQWPQYEKLGWTLRLTVDQGTLEGIPATEKILIWRDYTPEERKRMGEVRDAGYRFVRGYLAGARDIALGRLFKTVAESDFARKSEDATHTHRIPDTKVAGTHVFRYGKLAGMWVPENVADDILAMHEPHGALAGAYLHALSLWKEGKVSLNPVVHSNNIVSNLFMSDFAGTSPTDFKAYRATFLEYKNKGPMYREAVDHGLFGTEFFGTEIGEMFPAADSFRDAETLAAGKITRLVRTLAKVSGASLYRRKMGRLYQSEDQFFKLMTYMDRRAKGWTIDQSIDEAERYYFNYADVPKGVRVVKATALPFFSYTYKAAPALAHTALVQPWKIIKWAALFGGLNAAAFAWLESDDQTEGQAHEREVLDDYMKGRTSLGIQKAVRLPVNADGGEALYLDMSRRVPLGDVFDATNQMGGLPIPQPLTPNNPVLTTLMALVGNVDSFTGRQVVDRGVDTDWEALAKQGKWLVNQMMPNTPLLPGSYSWSKIMNGVASAVGHPIDIGIAEYTGKDFYGRETSLTRALLGTTVGFKIRTVDIPAKTAQRERELMGSIRDLKSRIRSTQRNQGLTQATKDARRAKDEARIQEVAQRLREVAQ